MDEIPACDHSSESHRAVRFLMGLFTVMCKVVLTSESVHESLTCDHRAVLSCGVVYNDAVTLCCTRWFQLLSQWMKSWVWKFKWKLLSSIFKWCQHLATILSHLGLSWIEVQVKGSRFWKNKLRIPFSIFLRWLCVTYRSRWIKLTLSVF